MGGTHEHLEHAEHAQHAAHDPFDKRVAMTMAVVAACLASVAVIGHREHTATLAAMGEAGNKRGDAAVTKNEASDAWSFYQAKNIRRYEFESFLALSNCLAKDPAKDEELKKTQKFWTDQINKYKKELPEMMDEAKRLDGKVKVLRAAAEKSEEQSHQSHARTHFFDGGHLFIDLALVICSIAILTKMRLFWYGGIAICAIGVAVAIVGFTTFPSSLVHHHEGHETPDTHHPPAQTAPEHPAKGGH